MARSGERVPIDLTDDTALEYARRAAEAFGVGDNRQVKFEKELAKLAVQDAKEKAKKKAK